jgi:hypothetical protein
MSTKKTTPFGGGLTHDVSSYQPIEGALRIVGRAGGWRAFFIDAFVGML